MRRTGLFVAGIIVGVLLRSALAEEHGITGLNHVAIAVDDFAAATTFYTQVMGFPEAFSFSDGNGSVLAYFQVSRDTFIELMPVTPDRPAGFVHYGLQVADVDFEASRLRAAGLKVDGPAVSARTKAKGASTTTPQGTRIELFEFGPESLQRKAMDSWKK